MKKTTARIERHALVKMSTHPEIAAVCFQIEGTKKLVLEFLQYGFACSSYYLLLRSASTLQKISDPETRALLEKSPTRFGKKLVVGVDLERDDTGALFYLVERGE